MHYFPMKPSLFAAAFMFDDKQNPGSGGHAAERPASDCAAFLAHACQDDPALRFRLADRAAFLARVCRDDPGLRARVEALLAAHMAAESFVNPPAPQRPDFPRT
jgi:hypothetical protein